MLPISDFKIIKKENNAYNLVGKIKVKLLVVTSIFVLCLFASQLVFANNLATDGQKLANIDDTIQQLQAENTTLRAQIAQVSSLANLSKKAQELGFEKPNKLIVLQ